MDDIAELAEVSVGTVYNYYKNKGDLLMAIVASSVSSQLHDGEQLIANPPQDPEEAMNQLLFAYLDNSIKRLDKDMWRHAIALSITQPELPNGSLYNALDEKLNAQVCSMISRLQALGLIDPDINAVDIGAVFFNNMNNQWYDFAKYEETTMDQYKQTLRQQNRVLIDAITIDNHPAD